MLNEMEGDSNSTKEKEYRLQRGNALSILKTLPDNAGLDQIFFL